MRQLRSLSGIGDAMMDDFAVLGIGTVEQLAGANPDELYERLCAIRQARIDVCCLDVFRCAVAQARDPELPVDQTKWWWWSRQRKAHAI